MSMLRSRSSSGSCCSNDSDDTLAGSEEYNDKTRDNSRTLRTQHSHVHNNSRRRQDSWMPNRLSPGGRTLDLSSRPLTGRESLLPCKELLSEKQLSVAIPGGDVAVPGSGDQPNSEVDKQIKPCFPTRRNRYDRHIVIAKNEQSWNFEPMDTLSIHDEYCDSRWSSNIHPEGQLYFASPRSSCERQFMFLTEEHLYDGEKVEEIEEVIGEFLKKAENVPGMPEMDVDVFISTSEHEGEGWFYYCVDNRRRCLFWIDAVDLTWMAEAVGSVPSKAHLKFGLDYEYWIHVEHFPFHQVLPDSLICDLMGVALHASVDSMTSLDSTVPFSKSEIQELVDTTKHLLTLQQNTSSYGYVVVSAARLMTIFVNERFHHFAGQNGARLTRDQSIRGEQRGRTVLIRLVSPLLCFAPEKQLESLLKLYVDGNIKDHPWKVFVNRLLEDWMQYVLFSTVLIAADVSFLAVPIVLPNNGIPPGASAPPAAVATQISLIAAMGSIIAGLLLIHEHRRKAFESAQAAAEFLRRRSHRSRGLETLAILYSLPFALLMWGMSSFLIALAIICFDYRVNGIIPTTVYAIASGLVLVTIGFAVLVQLEVSFAVHWWRFVRLERLMSLARYWRRTRQRDAGEDKEADCRRRSFFRNTFVRWKRNRRMLRGSDLEKQGW